MGKPASGRRRAGSGRTWVREVGLAFVTAGFVVLLFVAYELVGTNLSEEHSQSALAREFAAAVAKSPRAGDAAGKSSGTLPVTTASTGGTGAGGNGASPAGTHAGPTSDQGTNHPALASSGPAGSKHGAGAAPNLTGIDLPLPPPGGALDHLVIPAIDLSRYVVQGVAEPDLQMGPGHYPGTPLPGQAGNVGIAGHRTTFGAPFFRLNEVSRGDLVLLTDTSGTTWVYSVVHQWVVSPGDTAVLDPTPGAVLTLTTCNPRFEATSRLVVRAVLVERVPRGAKVPSRVEGVVSSRAGTNGPDGGSAPASAPSPVTGSPVASGTVAGGPVVGSPVTGNQVSGHRGVTTGSGTGEDSPVVGPADSAAATGGTTADAGGWAWLATIGFGLLALLGWVATRVFAARLRPYSKFLVLAAGTLVCLVPLWFAFENLVNLLPANI